ncbi:MAG: TIGR04206 family protein [Haloarculaceae archaeon]
MAAASNRPGSRARLLAVLAVGVVPWTVVYTRGFVTLVTPVALIDPVTGTVTTVVEYLQYTIGAPPSLMMPWLVAVGIYVLALASAALAFRDREDRRVTGGLLVLLGVTQVSLSIGFGRRPTYLAVPVATATCWAVAWWGYRTDLRRIVAGSR